MSSEQKATIRSYLEKYAKKHNITVEEAMEHAMCQLASLYLEDCRIVSSDVWSDEGGE